MIDYEILYCTLVTLAIIYVGSFIVDILRMLYFLRVENSKWNAFICKIEEDDFVDNDLLDEVILLMNRRKVIANKYT